MWCRRTVRRCAITRKHGAREGTRKWELRSARGRGRLVLGRVWVRRMRWRHGAIQGRREGRRHGRRRVREVRTPRDGGGTEGRRRLRRVLMVLLRRLGRWLFIVGVEGAVLARRLVGPEPMLLSRGLGVVWRSARHDGRVPGAGRARRELVSRGSTRQSELKRNQGRSPRANPMDGCQGGSERSSVDATSARFKVGSGCEESEERRGVRWEKGEVKKRR